MIWTKKLKAEFNIFMKTDMPNSEFGKQLVVRIQIDGVNQGARLSVAGRANPNDPAKISNSAHLSTNTFICTTAWPVLCPNVKQYPSLWPMCPFVVCNKWTLLLEGEIQCLFQKRGMSSGQVSITFGQSKHGVWLFWDLWNTRWFTPPQVN